VPEQKPLPLINGLQAAYSRAGERLLDEVERVIQLHVPKRLVLAEDIGIKEQHLSDALKSNGKHFALTWLPAVARYDRDHRLARMVASWHGLVVHEREPLTDAEYRNRLEAALRRAGAAGEAIRKDALEDET
jgi:hypothetical protein